MNIIQLIQKPQLRGAEIFACQLSNHLINAGHNVLIISIFKGDSKLTSQGKFVKLDRTITNRFFDLRGWEKFAQIVKDFKPDIVQANAGDTLKFAISSKLVFKWNAHIVFRNANKMGDFIDSKIKWYLNKFYLSKISYVISVSKECEQDLIKTFNFSRKKIRTVEIGVEEKKINDIPSDLVDIFKKGPVVIHIGSFVPEKNHNAIIDIFYELHAEQPNVQLLLIGRGQLEAEIKEKVSSLGLSNSVHFLGYRNHVLDILAHSLVFILPSLIEGLPGVILEAMYAKTPVIAYDVGGVKEILKKDTGWLIPKNNQNLFLIDLKKIVSGSVEVNDKVRNAKTLIEKKYLNKVISKRFEKCYKDVLA